MIIGGGIGGLCLAQGLRRAGIGVTVYERTVTRTDWLQGYRIHINPHGSRALHDCLPPAAWQRFLDSSRSTAAASASPPNSYATCCASPARRSCPTQTQPTRITASAGSACVRCCYPAWTRWSVLARPSSATRLPRRPRHCVLRRRHLRDRRPADRRRRRELTRPPAVAPDAERIDTGILAIAGKHRLDGELGHRVLPGTPTSLSLPAAASSSPHAGSTTATPPSDSVPETSCSTTPPTTPSGRTPTPQRSSRRTRHSGGADCAFVLDRTAGWAPGLQD